MTAAARRRAARNARHSRNGWLFGGLAALAVLALGLSLWLLWRKNASQAPALPAVIVPAHRVVRGDPMPEAAWPNLQGQLVRVSELAGRPVLINAWATWCPPCKAEMPDLVKYYEAHKGQNFTLLGIESGEPEAEVSAFIKEYGLTYPVWPDPDQAALHAFKEEYLPSSYLIDPQGQVRLIWSGPASLESLEQNITPRLED